MIATLSLLFRYLLTLAVYLFIYRIARLIYLDIKGIHQVEEAKGLGPHLKLLGTPVAGKPATVLEILPLNPETTTIGRAQDNDIRLPSPHVSANHARICCSESQATLEDLGSANGTTLNGQPVLAPVVLKDGDQIRIGDVALRYAKGGR